MNEQQFDIIFRGDIVLGHQLADVKVRMQQLFKTDAAKVDALFTGRPIPLKRNLDNATAQKYRDVLFKAGAQVEVVAAGEINPGKIAEKPAPKPIIWTLAPVGSYLLPSSEKATVIQRNIDTSALSLRAEGGNLLDASEQKTAEIAAVVAPDFEVAEIGSDLLDANEKWELPLIEIELEDWTIADVGANLVSESEKIIVPAPVINIPDVGLAPVGADLGQLKVLINPVVPDTSSLKLTDL